MFLRKDTTIEYGEVDINPGFFWHLMVGLVTVAYYIAKVLMS